MTDLQNLLSTFIHALLPPQPTVGSPTIEHWSPPLVSHSPTWESSNNSRRASAIGRNSSSDSVDCLPIAAKFLSHPPETVVEEQGKKVAGRDSAESEGSRRLEGSGSVENVRLSTTKGSPDTSVPFPSSAVKTTSPSARTRQSHPPIKSRNSTSTLRQRLTDRSSSTHALGSTARKLQRAVSAATDYTSYHSAPGGTEGSVAHSEVLGLPEDLREVLEVLRDGILPGHLALSKALRRRHEEQFPLIRSLADVFTQHVRSSPSTCVFVALAVLSTY